MLLCVSSRLDDLKTEICTRIAGPLLVVVGHGDHFRLRCLVPGVHDGRFGLNVIMCDDK